jgi:hypothetical protein
VDRFAADERRPRDRKLAARGARDCDQGATAGREFVPDFRGGATEEKPT